MRLEYNPKAMCYNLYCDTIEENEKLRRLLEKPFTATDIKSIGSKIYADTDSIKAMKTKLNSVYGKVVTDKTKNYIVVHTNNDQVAIIFKDKITGLFRHDDGTSDILLESGSMFNLKDKYEDIIKHLI